MVLFSFAVVGGLVLLVWSADRFVDGAAAIAAQFSVSPLLIGMVIVGFGTSAPEMMVSAFAAAEGNPGIALGNAYGSNIVNIALILGVTAIVSPIAVQSVVVKKEIPILLAVTALSAFLLADGQLERVDSGILAGAFIILMVWYFIEATRNPHDSLGQELQDEFEGPNAGSVKPFIWVLISLALLVGSSRLLVWGAVGIATSLNVPDLIVGLTIVAVGTSLPEFAASVSAARKGKPDLALGNVLGSNLFNTLVVVGIAGAIGPATVPQEILKRDLPVVGIVTAALLVVCFNFKGAGVITRVEGSVLLIAYIGYTALLILGSGGF